jgi:Fe-S cluster biogenesis protein NfuA
MKQGVEKIIKERIDNVLSVIAINQAGYTTTPEEKEKLTKLKLEELLGRLMPTIDALGGKIRIHHIDMDNGRLSVQFQGPDKLRKGLDVLLKENENVENVEYLPWEE